MRQSYGFTLIEVAVVLLVIGMVVAGLLIWQAGEASKVNNNSNNISAIAGPDSKYTVAYSLIRASISTDERLELHESIYTSDLTGRNKQLISPEMLIDDQYSVFSHSTGGSSMADVDEYGIKVSSVSSLGNWKRIVSISEEKFEYIFDNNNLAWSADGKKLLYLVNYYDDFHSFSDRGGGNLIRQALFSINLDGSENRQILSWNIHDNLSRLDLFGFNASSNTAYLISESSIHLINISSGNVQKVGQGIDSNLWDKPVLSPDYNYIYYIVDNQIFSYNLSENKSRLIYDSRINGTTNSDVYDDQARFIGPIAVVLGGKGLAFTTSDPNSGSWSLILLTLAEGSSKQLAAFDQNLDENIYASPDGRHIWLTYGNDKADVFDLATLKRYTIHSYQSGNPYQGGPDSVKASFIGWMQK